MNRIDEIVASVATDTSGRWVSIGDIKKVVESVALESIQVVNGRFMGDLNREDMEIRRCVDKLKEHFGVE